jgi:phage terminase large subunit GpA-like protein
MRTWPDARREALRALVPPMAMDLATWIESELVLPSNVSALPGSMRLHAHQRGICNAISDPTIETVSLVKPVRIGFSTLLIATVANYVANDPSNVMILLPTDDDCRDFMISDLGPIFDATPSLRGALVSETDEKNRNTMTSKRFPGGSLKCLAARSPRNLRRHNVRVLCCDEIDAMTVTVEGDALQLAIRRTLSFSNRKIIMGSTPALEAESAILKAYSQGDRRVFEVSCPSCSAWSEIVWADIKWSEGAPETAQWACPSCGVLHNEEHKHAMVAAGRWRALAPEVKGHASFRINALVSSLLSG